MASATDTGAGRSDQQRNVVIIGGGFAGVTLARALERRLPAGYDIFLLSRTDYITFNPLLPEVVGASVLPSHVVVPLRRLLSRTRIRMVEVTGIDFEARRVTYSQPIEVQFRSSISSSRRVSTPTCMRCRVSTCTGYRSRHWVTRCICETV